jgi:lysophospholipase L1-like esterase
MRFRPAVLISSRSVILPLLFTAAAFAQNGFYLKQNDRVVFYGDSITDQRLYTTFVESYVVTRFPGLDVTFTHSGWGGDRVSGGGGGPIDLRLSRDVYPYNPTVITIMLGMNDGGYRAFDDELFSRFKTGYEHILDSLKENAPRCRVAIIQPSPYDDVTRPPLFEGGYNATLLRYSDYLRGLASARRLDTADLNTPVVSMLKRASDIDKDQAARILPDRVHPAAAGHLIMAEALLKSWNAPALVSEADVDAATAKAQTKNAAVTDVKTGPVLPWTEKESSLPMPLDPKDKLLPLALRASDFVDALDREMLRVSGLSAGNYQLKIDGVAVGDFSNVDFDRGVNLATADTPMLRQALDVHALTLRRALIHNTRWRVLQVPMAEDDAPAKFDAMTALDRLDNQLTAEQRAAARPRPHRYEIALQQ